MHTYFIQLHKFQFSKPQLSKPQNFHPTYFSKQLLLGNTVLKWVRKNLRLMPLLSLILCTLISGCATTSYSQRSDVQQYIQQVSAEHNFDAAQLTQLFNQVKPDQHVIKAITKPHEALPWYAYRAIFLTPQRAEEGAVFWQQHADVLATASQRYGVAPEIIVAILGVETRYGHTQGSHNAFTALATLAFDYSPRAPYFRSELTQFLLLSRELPLNPLLVSSSYAGALGQPQFMPSSYRRYAVAYADGGHSDLFNNSDDAIVSVANYFHGNGWQAGEPVTLPARISGQRYMQILQQGNKPKLTIAQLAQYGIYPTHWLPSTQHAALLTFETQQGNEYWLGLDNFYAIMRYNTSPLYAMAVYQLSQQIKARYHSLAAKG